MLPDLYRPLAEGDAIRDLASELGLALDEEQLANFSTQDVLGLADGSLEIHRNPTTPYGHVSESVGPVGSNPGHEYI